MTSTCRCHLHESLSTASVVLQGHYHQLLFLHTRNYFRFSPLNAGTQSQQLLANISFLFLVGLVHLRDLLLKKRLLELALHGINLSADLVKGLLLVVILDGCFSHWYFLIDLLLTNVFD